MSDWPSEKTQGVVGQGHNTNYVCAEIDPDRVRNSPGVSEELDDPWPILPKGLDSPRYQSLRTGRIGSGRRGGDIATNHSN